MHVYQKKTILKNAFITNTNKLYIKSKGKIVGISGAGDNNLDDDETMTQVVKSEVTGLCVPNKVRWMYYLTVKG